MAQMNTLVSIRSFIAQESFNLLLVHRSVPAFLEGDQAGGAPEFPLRSLFDGNELDDWLARFGDNDLLSGLCSFDQPRELSLG